MGSSHANLLQCPSFDLQSILWPINCSLLPSSYSACPFDHQFAPCLSLVKMKIFQSIQRNFATLDITVSQSREPSLISRKHLIICVILCANIVTNVVSIISLAESFDEYTFCIYGSFTLTMTGMEFIIHIWKMRQLFQFIENFEQLIETSELTAECTTRAYQYFTFNFGICRIDESNFKDHLHAIERTGRETEWNIKLCYEEFNIAVDDGPSVCVLLC